MTVMLKAASEALAVPSAAVMTIFRVVPVSVIFGLPESRPVVVSKLAHEGGFWIENASVEWNEAEAPFHSVARLTLLGNSQLSAEASEAAYFDVTNNSTPDSRPVGSINRARWTEELESRKARMGV